MNTLACNPLIDDYFSRLDSQMSDLPMAQRQEFTRELRAHVVDRLEQVTVATEADCRSVLKALGTPEEIARQYRMELILKRPSWKISPMTVLRTTLRWTVTGIQGYAIFVVALIGYLLSACFYLTAVLKPFFPRNVGVFVSEEGVNLARFPVPPPGHEILGAYYIPAAVLAGYLFTFGTTLLIRFLLRRGRSLRQRLV